MVWAMVFNPVFLQTLVVFLSLMNRITDIPIFIWCCKNAEAIDAAQECDAMNDEQGTKDDNIKIHTNKER